MINETEKRKPAEQDKLHIAFFVIVSLVVGVLAYRVVVDESPGTSTLTALVVVLALGLLVVLSKRLIEFSAGISGVNAKLRGMNDDMKSLRTFMYGSVDSEALKTLAAIKRGNLETSSDDRDKLKFHIRTLRSTGLVVRDESKCSSVSSAVKGGGNISSMFIVTPNGDAYLKEMASD